MSQDLQPLSQILPLDGLPEIFSFLTTPVSSMLDNVKVRQVQNQPFFTFNRESFLLVLRAEQKLSLELPGTGFALVLNPAFDPGNGVNHTDFFVSISIDRGTMQGVWDEFSIESFSASPREVYDKLMDYFDVSEFDSIWRLLLLSSQDANAFILSINSEYQSTIVADIDLDLNLETQVNELIEKINDSVELASIPKFVYDIVYDLYINSGVGSVEKFNRLNLFLSQELSVSNALEFIFSSLLPKIYADISLTAGIEFPRSSSL